MNNTQQVHLRVPWFSRVLLSAVTLSLLFFGTVSLVQYIMSGNLRPVITVVDKPHPPIIQCITYTTGERHCTDGHGHVYRVPTGSTHP